MRPEEIHELHFITPISTIPSILEKGILCHNLAKNLDHEDLSDSAVQERRSRVKIPNARLLHDYVNLYFDAHNPMLSKIRYRNRDICVLAIDCSIIRQDGVIITDRNAAKDYVRFDKYPDGLEQIDRSMLYARYWTHDDPFLENEHKGIKCAEVLIPDKVKSEYINKAYVVDDETRKKMIEIGFVKSVEIKIDMFF